jgi:hypothetical protein
MSPLDELLLVATNINAIIHFSAFKTEIILNVTKTEVSVCANVRWCRMAGSYQAFGIAYWACLQGLSSSSFGVISTHMSKHLETPHAVGIKLG